MKRKPKAVLVMLIAFLTIFLQTYEAQVKSRTATTRSIDDAKLRDADARTSDWLTHGRTYSETRFSPLKQINTDNVKNLGLAWAFDTETTRGLEATPIVVDGVIYTTGSWSVVFAVDARTGKQIWKWDPHVLGAFGQ